jgi:hypothetical protein
LLEQQFLKPFPATHSTKRPLHSQGEYELWSLNKHESTKAFGLTLIRYHKGPVDKIRYGLSA